jgi:hypothetical protein
MDAKAAKAIPSAAPSKRKLPPDCSPIARGAARCYTLDVRSEESKGVVIRVNHGLLD